ncbi:unnamed protein product [Periconia digitata]|uniref:Uncharacterized protein n=1 Tax=Periconia digitata TaxID=1303443 RepID=A0A9W4UBQ6_9PLEO|nr:unnamed protein product [Periconia digitata]
MMCAHESCRGVRCEVSRQIIVGVFSGGPGFGVCALLHAGMGDSIGFMAIYRAGCCLCTLLGINTCYEGRGGVSFDVNCNFFSL